MSSRSTRLGPEVEKTLRSLSLQPEDSGAAQLARRYAAAIDALTDDELPRLIGTIGPSLLRCLQALGATPESRSVPARGGDPGVSPARTALDELRSRRKNRAASVDSSA